MEITLEDIKKENMHETISFKCRAKEKEAFVNLCGKGYTGVLRKLMIEFTRHDGKIIF